MYDQLTVAFVAVLGFAAFLYGHYLGCQEVKPTIVESMEDQERVV